MSTLDVIVATIGRAHGLRGEVALILRTDQPEERMHARCRLRRSTPQAGPRTLTVLGTRSQQDRWYVHVRRGRGPYRRGIACGAWSCSIAVDSQEEADEDPDAWYPSQLKGLAVRHVDGRELGTVVGVDHYPAQDLLVVRTPTSAACSCRWSSSSCPRSTSRPGSSSRTRPAVSSTSSRRTSRDPEPETSAPAKRTKR